jgi:hypothetical protein
MKNLITIYIKAMIINFVLSIILGTGTMIAGYLDEKPIYPFYYYPISYFLYIGFFVTSVWILAVTVKMIKLKI